MRRVAVVLSLAAIFDAVAALGVSPTVVAASLVVCPRNDFTLAVSGRRLAETPDFTGDRGRECRSAAKVELQTCSSDTPLVAAQPRHPVYLIYDGFVRNADGSLTLAFGYYNVNRVVVTVEGEDNAFLPGATDRGQPTVFLPGRQRFACVMVVPGVFDGQLQWQVRFAGHESVTTARLLDPLYALEEVSAREAVEGIELDGAPPGVCLQRDPANQLQ